MLMKLSLKKLLKHQEAIRKIVNKRNQKREKKDPSRGREKENHRDRTSKMIHLLAT